ncbi:MAG: hypothetical protein HYV96_02360 [Opitutae bacterium]|nr:hypothetical protein [Opitutae bacterium]
MPSSTSNSEFDFARVVPSVPWKAVLAAVVALTATAAVGWEYYARRHGYSPSLNDTPDLWAQTREKVQPNSLVLVGTSRMLFDADLDVLEKAFGQRPVQLALAGSSPFPVLEDLAKNESFHGTVIVDIVPAMFLAPAGPPMEVSQKALKRKHEWNLAQRWSHQLGMLLEERLAFLKQEDLTLGQLLQRVPIPDRADAAIGPALPPYFYTVDRDRRGRMFDEAAVVGSPLQQRVAHGWLPLFTLPPPPKFIPADKFGAMMGQAIEQRFEDTQKHVAALRARGARVVFVRLPVDPILNEKEEKIVPLAAGWGRLVAENGVPAINFADHAELAAFKLPEWSHLSAPDSVEFTQCLVPHLREAVERENQRVAKLTAAATGAPSGSQ